MSRTSMHPNAIGRGELRALQSQHMKRATGTNDEYCLYISYNPEVYAGAATSVDKRGATLHIPRYDSKAG